MIAPASASDQQWREAWKAQIAALGHLIMPALLRSRTPLKPLVLAPLRLPAPAAPAAPAPKTPIPEPAPRSPETGPMRRLDTEVIPAVKLISVDVQGTNELISAAVQRFYLRHRYLPEVVALNPLRALAIPHPDAFEVGYRIHHQVGGQSVELDLCCTVQVVQSGLVESDEVQVRFPRGWESYRPGGQR